MYATTQPLSRSAAVIPPLVAAPADEWPGDIDDDPAYLEWLAAQYDVECMRADALSSGVLPGLVGRY